MILVCDGDSFQAAPLFSAQKVFLPSGRFFLPPAAAALPADGGPLALYARFFLLTSLLLIEDKITPAA